MWPKTTTLRFKINSKAKIFRSTIIFLSEFEDDKHRGGTPLAKWNPLTKNQII